MDDPAWGVSLGASSWKLPVDVRDPITGDQPVSQLGPRDWRAAVQRQFALHRLLIRFSYAMTFGAVTLRLQIPIGIALGYPNYSATSV